MQIMFAVLTAVFMFILVPRAAVSVGTHRGGARDRAQHPRPGAPDRAAAMQPSGRTVEFRDVEFRYPGAEEPVLQRHLVHGQRRAGPRPSWAAPAAASRHSSTSSRGCTTSPAGAVLVDGVDVREMDREDSGNASASCPRSAFLFSGTVASNLRYGDEDASDEELWRALDIAQGRDFVAAMEGQLEAPVAQGGTNVSGGQRQRLAIARALVEARAGLHLRRQLLRARLRD